MAGNNEIVDLKANVKRNVQGLRYLYNVMDECGQVNNFEHCLDMARNYIKHIADDLELQTK